MGCLVRDGQTSSLQLWGSKVVNLFVCLSLRRVPSATDQNAGRAEGGGGGGQVPEGGAPQAGQHAEEGEEPDGHAQQSEEV